MLIGLCTLTFVLGTGMLSGLVLLVLPELPQRFVEAPKWASIVAGAVMLGGVALYVLGSWLHLKPIKVAGLHRLHSDPGRSAFQTPLALR